MESPLNQFRVRLSVLLYDGNKLPFSVQPAILFKVDPMFVVALHEVLTLSRSSITGRWERGLLSTRIRQRPVAGGFYQSG